MSKKVIKTVSEPTDLVLIGSADRYDKRNFMIDDDYCGFHIAVGDQILGPADSDGFGVVIEASEFEDWNDVYEGDGWEDIVDAFLLKGFVGKIELSVMKADGSHTDAFDVKDFIWHQFDEDTDGNFDVVVTLPEGTSLIKVDDFEDFETKIA